MAARTQKRLNKELGELMGGAIPGVEIKIINDQITNWNVCINGPENTSYAGGIFVVNIDFSDNYPFKCPKMQFVTKIYHPNIKTETGEICADAIKNSWVPTMNAQYIIKMMIELMENPNADNPMEAEIARVYQTDKTQYENNAIEFTKKYA